MKLYLRQLYIIAFISIFPFGVGADTGEIKSGVDDQKRNNTMLNSRSTNILKDKPYFTLRIETENAAFSVDINGITISKGTDEAPFSIEIPVNHWMRTGDNSISLTLLGYTDQSIKNNARAKVSLRVKPSGGSRLVAQEISSLQYIGELSNVTKIALSSSSKPGFYNSIHNFYADEKGDVKISDLVITEKDINAKQFVQTITLTTPFPEWAFFRSENLPVDSIETMSEHEYDKFLQGPFEVYKEIADLIQRQDIKSIEKLFEERNREYDAAYYDEPGTKEKEVSASLKKIVKRPKTVMLPVSKEYFIPYFHPNRKIMKLVTEDLADVISFNLEDIDSNQSYEILLRREKGQWIITR